MAINSQLQWLLGIAVVLYLIVMTAISYLAQRKVHTVEDFLVAGRSLPLSISWMTLLATWFGAGTILAAADEVRSEGLQAAALDPLGAGSCLLFAAMFVAGPMWRMKLLTVCDFFRNRYGPGTELLSAAVLIPSYFGWVAAQFIALASILQLFFGMPLWLGLVLVAFITTAYTLMGGMWTASVNVTAHIPIVLAGLVLMAVVLLAELGNGSSWAGLERIGSETSPEMLTVIPLHDWRLGVGWLGVFITGALGNIPGQDLMQRIFSCKSARVAQASCYVAGGVYLLFGCIPLLLALGGSLLFPEHGEKAILPFLAQAFLSPWLAMVFLLALMSAILSTVDSAMLSPASVLATNVFSRFGSGNLLRKNRIAVLIIALCSLLVAFLGEDAYSLLEEAYLMTLVGLFVPLMMGIYFSPRSRRSAACSILAGSTVWLVHFLAGWEHFLEPLAPWNRWQLPVSLTATFASLLGYLLCEVLAGTTLSRNSATAQAVSVDSRRN